jgi:hypothetical protein
MNCWVWGGGGLARKNQQVIFNKINKFVYQIKQVL